MSTHEVTRLTTYAVLLTLGLFGVAEAENKPTPSDNMKPFSVTDETAFKEGRIRGEVVHISGSAYAIKTKNGKEVRLHRDTTTKVVGEIKQGDLIEAEVDNKNHVLAIQSFSQSDADKTNAGMEK